MNRRKFLRDASTVATGVGLPGLAMGKAARGTQQANDGIGAPVIRLSGEWLIATDPQDAGREQKWFDAPVSGAQPARVPGILQETFPTYHGVVWYWHEFVPPAHSFQHGRYLLQFGAVDYLAEVWVNGVSVGGHEGGDTPFVLDATDAIQPGANNRLAVRVLNPTNERIDGIVLAETPHKNKRVPFSFGSSHDYGGILGTVELQLTPAVYVENVFVRPDWKTGKIRVQVNVRNTTSKAALGHLECTVAPAATGATLASTRVEYALTPNDTLVEIEIHVEDHRLWDLENPYLYRLTTQVKAEGAQGFSEASVGCGFRDFRVVDGYFRLNGKRIFVRSAHLSNRCPIGLQIPPSHPPDLLRRDMLYGKALGFNTVRFLSRVAEPYQLDLCDELGFLVYEESFAAWLLKDTPKMKERYDFSVREMVLRDRNHPCLVMWGMLNETGDGPVFRHAVESLKLVRSLDDTRVVLLGSGRFDGNLDIGSVSNPGSSQWEYLWGKEAPGAPQTPNRKEAGFPSVPGVGDFHFYPRVPQTPQADHLLRTLGEDSKPVFLTEYGIGSMFDVIGEGRMYEQVRARKDLEDFVLIRTQAENLVADLKRYGMDSVYPFPADLLLDSQYRMARHRLLGFNLIRSNPKLCGFSMTMMNDPMTGEGVWKLWRQLKPAAADALQDGWAPLRWCLFVEPTHTYVGRPLTLEAVLATEDVLAPGAYPARFRAWSPTGVAWERQANVQIPPSASGGDGPLAVPVLKEEVTLPGTAGVYELAADLEQGGSPSGRKWQFYLSDPASLPRISQTLTLWGLEEKAESWLRARGATCEPFGGTAPNRREIILVADLAKAASDANGWQELARRMARGSAVVFLSPLAFQREKDSTAWLPLARKGRCYKFNDWLYHKECVAKTHPIFEGLQGKGILDWYYYGPVIPHYLFEGQDTPDDVAAAAFATGYPVPGGYTSGVLCGSYRLGEGRFVLNTFPVLENLDAHPAADRLLLNLIAYAAGFVDKPLAELPSNFDAQLKAIGYLP